MLMAETDVKSHSMLDMTDISFSKGLSLCDACHSELLYCSRIINYLVPSKS